MQRIITIILSILFLFAGMTEPWFMVLGMAMLWYVCSHSPQTKKILTTKQKVGKFFKGIFFILIFLALLVFANFTYEGRFFLVFLFINGWGMTDYPEDKKKIVWRPIFSVMMFSLLALSMLSNLMLPIFILTVYWYVLHRYKYIISIRKSLESLFANEDRIKKIFSQVSLEGSYFLLMFLSSFFVLVSKVSYGSYYSNYFRIGNPIAVFFFFSLLILLSYFDKKYTAKLAQAILPETKKVDTVEEVTVKEQSIVQPETEIETVAKKEKKKRPSYIPIILNFLSKNIANIVLLLGVLFILTAAITFLRSNWQDFKYLVFACFVLITSSLFVGGYVVHRKKNLDKLSFLLLLLATIFFPLVFYFAVKVGLLHDRGNKYIVIWLTTIITMIHARLFRSVCFTLMTIAMFSWANWLTLVKFGIPQYEGFASFYAIQSILFLVVSLYYRLQHSILHYTLVVASNLSFIFTLVLGIFFWQASVFLWVMLAGMMLAYLQMRFVANSWMNYYNGILFAASTLGFVATLSNLAQLSVFWMGVPVAAVAFINMNVKYFFPLKLESETERAIKSISFITPLIVLAIYLLWGGYSSYNGTYSLFTYTILCGVGYIACAKEYPQQLSIYLGLLFSTLAIWEMAKIGNVHPHNYTIIFLTWATFLAYLASETKIKNTVLIAKPLQKFSLCIVPISLLYILIQGYEYYYDSFTSLNTSLLFVSIFCIYMAQRLQRNDLFLTGVVTTISFATLLVHRVNPEFYFLAMVVIVIATFGLFCAKYLRLFDTVGDKKYKLLFSPIVWTFALAALFLSLGQNVWEIKIVYVLSAVFFFSSFYLFSSTTDLYFGFLHTTILYCLFFYNQVSFFDWGIYLLPFAICQTLFAIKINNKPISKHFFLFAKAVFVFSILLFLSFIHLQYQQDMWIYPLLLVITNIFVCKYNETKLHTISLFVLSYTLYFFVLPKNWFLFQYALFYIPVAIAGFIYYYNNKDKNYSTLLLRFAHGTVLFFILLPAALPGMVPSAKVSMWVIALAFVFYFVGLYYNRKPIYSYISTLLFSACLLTALFALKNLWGNEIAFCMMMGNVFLLAIATLCHKKYKELTEPVFHVIILNTLIVVSSLLVIGKLYYSALGTCLLSSFVIMVVIHLASSIQMRTKNTLAYIALFLFATSYYFLLEKINLEPQYSALLIMLLAFAYTAVSFVFIESKYSKIYLYCSILLPALALKHVGDSLNLCILLALSSVMYGFIAERKQSKSFAVLTTSTLTLAVYSFLSYISFAQSQIMLFALIISWNWFYFAWQSEKQTKYSFAIPAMLQSAFLNQLIYFGLYFYSAEPNLLYFTIITSFINCGMLLLLSQKISIDAKKQTTLMLSIFSFMFSYYVMIFSWAVSVWEFYTIPIGLLMITYAYIANRRQNFAFFKDVVFAGLLLILLPTFIQSYHGWFDHLYYLGVSPYTHLKHSILLCIESLILIFVGIASKRFLLFVVGSTFLLSDVALVLFAYVDFGVIPQSIWWASLGGMCITFWVLMEYKKEWLLNVKQKISNVAHRSKESMKTWS